MVVDHDGGNSGDQAHCGGEQRLGDAGSDHGKVGGVRFGNADEGVHDAPHRAEQADERCGCADGGKHAGAARDSPRHGRFDAAEAKFHTLLEAFIVDGIRQRGFRGGGLHQLRYGILAAAGVPLGFRQRDIVAENLDALLGTLCFVAQFEQFRNADRPGDERCEGKADHHQFDDDIRAHEHAPRRQVVRQGGILCGLSDHRLLRGGSFGSWCLDGGCLNCRLLRSGSDCRRRRRDGRRNRGGR